MTQATSKPSGWVPSAHSTFGNRLKLVRATLKLSQIDFAAAIGVPHQTLSTWERGVTPISVDVFEIVNRVYQEFGVNRDYLAYGELNPEADSQCYAPGLLVGV